MHDLRRLAQPLFDDPPVAPTSVAELRARARRKRVHSRLVVSATVVVVVVLGAVGIAINHSLTTTPHLSVIGKKNPSRPPSFAQPLQPAPVGALDFSPAGPYRAGQSVHISYKPEQSGPASALNPGIAVCYPWAGGETCDPTIQSRLVSTQASGTATYALTVPGWVYTPSGLQSCEVLSCRFEIENADGARVGTPPVHIAPGPEPASVARIVGIDPNEAAVKISLDGLLPDPSWSRWSATASPTAVAQFSPGAIRICVFAARLLCDGLVQPAPPSFDGDPHTVTVASNRLILTSDGWIDCGKVVSAIAITRAIDVEVQGKGETAGPDAEPIVQPIIVSRDGGIVRSGTQTLALLPYRLPSTVPEMQQPRLTFAPAGPFYNGDTVTATLHNPPPNVDADSRLLLWSCSGVDLQTAGDCSGPTKQAWSKLADGSLQQRTVLDGADPKNGIYLAVGVPTTGYNDYPWVARTDPFTVTLTPAEQQQVNQAQQRRLRTKQTTP